MGTNYRVACGGVMDYPIRGFVRRPRDPPGLSVLEVTSIAEEIRVLASP